LITTNDDGAGRNVKVIWYELPDIEDSADAFTRLNVGKIPLTNAELIRALFLKSRNFDERTVSLQQIKITQEWDGIEKILQREEVWYFLHRGSDSPPNRIEYLFQLIDREQCGIDPSEEDPFHTFRFYNEKLSKRAAKADAEWLEVKKYFMTLEEWFSDRTLYHLIGYLIHDGDDLLQLRKAAGTDAKKSAFRRTLRRRIFKRRIGSELADHASYEELKTVIKMKVDDLEYGYGQDSAEIRSFLLLFNIVTLIQNNASNLRFPFDGYKKENWDIEHVRSVESGKPNRPDDQKDWLKHASECLDESGEDQNLRQRIQTLISAQKFDGTQLDQLYNDLLKRFGETSVSDADNSIGNLALLDAQTNRSYKNAVFPVKRRVIVRRDREGTFVPLCTKNVFLKCYSRRINNMMFWTKEDSQDYLETIIGTLAGFFTAKEGGGE
jgi:hypothetical protein